MLLDSPRSGTPFTFHVIVGSGLPLAEHLMDTSEPIMLSWLSGSDTHSGGSGETQTAYYPTDECHYKKNTEHLTVDAISGTLVQYMLFSMRALLPEMLHLQVYPLTDRQTDRQLLTIGPQSS